MRDIKQSINEVETVSVLIPVYNVDKYLAECMDSVVGQTYRQLEIIVIDDGSTDRSGQIADEYAKTDSRIKVIHQQNGGLSVARNTGLAVATGEFIAMIDSDDWVAPNWIETQMETIKRWNADVAVCGAEMVYQNSRQHDDLTLVRNFITEYDDKKKLTLMQGEWSHSAFAQGHIWKKLIRRECIVDHQLTFISDRRYCEDELFIQQVYQHTNRVAFNDKTIYFYRMRGTSLVSASKAVFRWLKARVLMHETHLINDTDLLETNMKAVGMMKHINPKDLLPWESELFYQTIAWCRRHIEDLDKTNLSVKQKVAVYLCLTKLMPLTIKQKIFALTPPLEQLLQAIKFQRNSSNLNSFCLPKSLAVSQTFNWRNAA